MQNVIVTVRVRWVAIAALFVVAAACLYSVCHVAGGIDSMLGVARRVSYGALFAVGFWGASHVLQKWMSHPVRPPYPTRSFTAAAPVYSAAGYAGAPVPVPAPQAITMGPGHYRVSGIDRDTHFQTTEIVYADSPHNAQLKVELKGVKVADVERAG